MCARPSAPPPSRATPMRGRDVGVGCGAEGFSCAKQIEQRSSSEEKTAGTQKFRMNVLHRGLGGGESESALSVSQVAGSGKGLILKEGIDGEAGAGAASCRIVVVWEWERADEKRTMLLYKSET